MFIFIVCHPTSTSLVLIWNKQKYHMINWNNSIIDHHLPIIVHHIEWFNLHVLIVLFVDVIIYWIITNTILIQTKKNVTKQSIVILLLVHFICYLLFVICYLSKTLIECRSSCLSCNSNGCVVDDDNKNVGLCRR